MKDIAKFVVFAGLFAIPFIPLLVADSMFFPFITGKNFAFRILVEIIFAAWVILALYEPVYRPRFSWVLGGLGALLVVMFFANLFGEYQLKSFWSNFERMEGYVTLVHFFLYFLVAGSVLITEKLWNRYLWTIIGVAVAVGMVAFAQVGGFVEHRYGGIRADGTLGNATYMAVYMLFSAFLTMLLFARTDTSKRRWLRYAFPGLILLFSYLLIQTATRGTTLALAVGIFVATMYILLFGKNQQVLRKVAFGGLLAVVLLTGTFVAVKDQEFVKDNLILKRLSSISLEEGQTRFTIWGMAVEGFKERPILGWGQGNFNYVFNQQYKPSLYAQEQWFDRVHNIVMDWLIAGGILGFVAYFSVFFSAIYYLFIGPLRGKGDETFTVTERGILLGLLAGYFVHNIFVFDNIVSYIFYGTTLAFIHSRVATGNAIFHDIQMPKKVIEQIAAPVAIVVMVGAIYFVNAPGILAARDIIHAFKAPTPGESLAQFEKALSRDSFGDQEIREQMTRQTQNIISSNQISGDLKQTAFKKTEDELLKQIEEKPGDARVHVFISSFYRFTNNFEPAAENLAIARSFSPNKQQIIFEQGLVEIQRQDFDAALGFFKEAYELAPEYAQARILYASAALFAGQLELAHELVDSDFMRQFSRSDFAIQAAYTAGDYDLLKEMYQIRIDENSNDPQLRTSLAVMYQESGDTDTAIQILEKAGEDIPSFKEQADGFIESLRIGKTPGQAEVRVGGEEVDSQTR